MSKLCELKNGEKKLKQVIDLTMQTIQNIPKFLHSIRSGIESVHRKCA